ncbi:MAG: preprotein translocase subunit SecG [Alphaproteobacteria bacterium]
MENVILVIHLLVALAMILLILIQRTAQDGGGLTGGGTMGGVFTARGSANVLSRTTAILATIFIVTSLALTVLAGNNSGAQRNLNIETIAGKPATQAPASPEAPAAPTPLTAKDVKPTAPVAPAVPMAQ